MQCDDSQAYTDEFFDDGDSGPPSTGRVGVVHKKRVDTLRPASDPPQPRVSGVVPAARCARPEAPEYEDNETMTAVREDLKRILGDRVLSVAHVDLWTRERHAASGRVDALEQTGNAVLKIFGDASRPVQIKGKLGRKDLSSVAVQSDQQMTFFWPVPCDEARALAVALLLAGPDAAGEGHQALQETDHIFSVIDEVAANWAPMLCLRHGAGGDAALRAETCASCYLHRA